MLPTEVRGVGADLGTIYLKDETLAHSPNMGLRILSLAIVVTLALVRAFPSIERAQDIRDKDREDMKDVTPGTQFNRKKCALCFGLKTA